MSSNYVFSDMIFVFESFRHPKDCDRYPPTSSQIYAARAAPTLGFVGGSSILRGTRHWDKFQTGDEVVQPEVPQRLCCSFLR